MKREIMIEGMSCNHCKMRVENALNNVAGVHSAEVILAEGKAVVESDSSLSNRQLIEVIDDAGYDVIEIK
jgi:Cu+-exporting ATPase